MGLGAIGSRFGPLPLNESLRLRANLGIDPSTLELGFR